MACCSSKAILRFVEAFLVGANQELITNCCGAACPPTRERRRFAGSGHTPTEPTTSMRSACWDNTTAVGSHVKTDGVDDPAGPQRARPPLSVGSRGRRSRRMERRTARVPRQGFIDSWCCPHSEVESAPTCSTPDSHSPRSPTRSARARPRGLPGWFFLLSENPGDPRFGLDPDGGTAATDARDTELETSVAEA